MTIFNVEARKVEWCHEIRKETKKFLLKLISLKGNLYIPSCVSKTED
jgi:hypothetical protein